MGVVSINVTDFRSDGINSTFHILILAAPVVASSARPGLPFLAADAFGLLLGSTSPTVRLYKAAPSGGLRTASTFSLPASRHRHAPSVPSRKKPSIGGEAIHPSLGGDDADVVLPGQRRRRLRRRRLAARGQEDVDQGGGRPAAGAGAALWRPAQLGLHLPRPARPQLQVVPPPLVPAPRPQGGGRQALHRRGGHAHRQVPGRLRQPLVHHRRVPLRPHRQRRQEPLELRPPQAPGARPLPAGPDAPVGSFRRPAGRGPRGHAAVPAAVP
ncbi:unnamed protein product [Triticum turgidum subsp. durum]|uniref:Uncharacterized protein n=1 Tax=Triticum turgidum subsp. durum TaxID=4567 RepID=A0A9R0S4I2_TRITD|nr:unnamed protein product [Triticum turgidum subsp. durum]